MADLTAIVAEQTQVVQPQGQLITVKLNDTNFLVWKQQILAAAKGYGLEGFLTGKHTIPGESITSDSGKKEINPAYTTWMRQDQLLASWLLSSLSENILITTVGLSSSKEIWESLETSFASQSRAKIMQFRLQLQTLKKGNLPMRDYLNKVKVCCDTLAAAGQKVSEEDQMLHILSGLGNDYDSVMVSITSRVEPCSLREVYALLLSFEARLENAESSQINMDGSTINANFAAQTYVPRRGGGNQFFLEEEDLYNNLKEIEEAGTISEVVITEAEILLLKSYPFPAHKISFALSLPLPILIVILPLSPLLPLLHLIHMALSTVIIQ
ncbi:hypothetical protein DH2020_007395 [Rehmannia glutinosa]|uniref:Retrotransposon Copia-like N-terminal domain-containing protein n=1 Tax=Rehmannia glutinosa TaxID=99300 RepID=A0ABR0TYI4_REHGL